MFAAYLYRFFPLSLATIPLVIAPGLLFYFDVTPKAFLLLLVTGLWLLFTSRNEPGLSGLAGTSAGRWLIIVVAAQAVSVIASTAFAEDLPLALTGGAWRRYGCVMELCVLAFTVLLASRFAGLQDALRPLLRASALSSLLISIYATVQFLGVDPFLPTSSYHIGEGIWTIVRPPSTLGHAAFLADYLIYSTFFAVALFFYESETWWKRLGVAAIAADSLGVVLSGTRAGILGLAVGGVILMVCLGARKRRIILLACSASVIVLAGIAVTPIGQPLRARIKWSRDDTSGGARLLLWKDSARMSSARWLTGFGPDHFARKFPQFQSMELARAYPDFYQESPHNLFLDAAIAQGIAGIVLLAATLSTGFVALWRLRTLHPAMAASLTAALAGGIVSGQFSSPTLVSRLYLLATVAIVCGLAGGPGRGDTKNLRWTRLFLLPAAIVFLSFGCWLIADDYLAGRFQSSVRSHDAERAVNDYRITSRYAIPGYAIDLYASRSLGQIAVNATQIIPRSAAWQAALQAAVRATQTAEDRQNAFLNLAQMSAMQNDTAGTERSLRAAIEFAPNWFKPHWILAEFLRRTGRIQEAREQARIAFDADGGKNPEVQRTWAELGSPR